MNRLAKQIRGVLVALVMVAALVVPSAANDRQSRVVNLQIVHVNDLHGYVDPIIDEKVSANSSVGGFAYLKSVIDKLRAANPQGTLVLNAGDLAEGTMLSYLSRGESVCKVLDTFGFDAMTLGNHDFAWGYASLQHMLECLHSPILAANIVRTCDGSCLPGCIPYMIKDIQGVKVGIIGLDTPNIRHFVSANKLQGLEFRKGLDTLRWFIPIMRQGGAELIVVLSHMGYEPDVALATQFPGIDVIVGGHSHTQLNNGALVNGTIIVQASSLTKYVGKLDLTVEPASSVTGHASKARIVNWKAHLIPVVTAETKPDAQVEAILAPYRRQTEAIGAQVLGEALETIHHGHREAAKLNQIHADSLWKASSTEFGICNSRSLRAHVGQGPVTYRDLYLALPFTEENYVTMHVLGQAVLDEIEDDLRDKATELAVPAGLSYCYDPKLPEGKRLTEVVLSDGSALEPQREYFIFTNETMSRKPAFRHARDKKVLGPVQPLFFEAVKANSPLRDNPDSRVQRL